MCMFVSMCILTSVCRYYLAGLYHSSNGRDGMQGLVGKSLTHFHPSYQVDMLLLSGHHSLTHILYPLILSLSHIYTFLLSHTIHTHSSLTLCGKDSFVMLGIYFFFLRA